MIFSVCASAQETGKFYSCEIYGDVLLNQYTSERVDIFKRFKIKTNSQVIFTADEGGDLRENAWKVTLKTYDGGLMALTVFNKGEKPTSHLPAIHQMVFQYISEANTSFIGGRLGNHTNNIRCVIN